MRFRKGSKVEELNFKYGRRSPDVGGYAERVTRKAIRPCPPSLEGPKNWVAGDVIEVFDNSSWKIAEVTSVLIGDYFFVKLPGCHKQLRVHASDLRPRESWQDDELVVLQDYGKYDEEVSRFSRGKFNQQMQQQCMIMKDHSGDHSLPFVHVNAQDECLQLCSRGMKRKPPSRLPPHVGQCNGTSIKMRAVEKKGKRKQYIAVGSPHLLDKVGASTSTYKAVDKKFMSTSLKRTTGLSQMGMARGKPDSADEYHFTACLEPTETENMSSSVASCSTIHHQCTSVHPIISAVQYKACPTDEANSHCVSRREESLHAKEVLGAEVHQLEMSAYRSTMKALHASGSISWEQEALMTNLRLMLHISNDEHLLELKQLTASGE